MCVRARGRTYDGGVRVLACVRVRARAPSDRRASGVTNPTGSGARALCATVGATAVVRDPLDSIQRNTPTPTRVPTAGWTVGCGMGGGAASDVLGVRGRAVVDDFAFYSSHFSLSPRSGTLPSGKNSSITCHDFGSVLLLRQNEK